MHDAHMCNVGIQNEKLINSLVMLNLHVVGCKKQLQWSALDRNNGGRSFSMSQGNTRSNVELNTCQGCL